MKVPLLFLKKLKEKPQMTRLRGCERAKILFLTPPPTEDEYKRNLPFSSQEAQVANEIMLEHEFDLNKDCLVIPCILSGLKATKLRAVPVQKFLASCARKCLYEGYVVFGGEALRFLFGRGKRTSMSSLVGNILFVQETGFKPLFVMPGLENLVAPTEFGLPREIDFRNREYNRAVRQFETLVIKLVDWWKCL
jgi:hypothetical protein